MSVGHYELAVFTSNARTQDVPSPTLYLELVRHVKVTEKCVEKRTVRRLGTFKRVKVLLDFLVGSTWRTT